MKSSTVVSAELEDGVLRCKEEEEGLREEGGAVWISPIPPSSESKSRSSSKKASVRDCAWSDGCACAEEKTLLKVGRRGVDAGVAATVLVGME